MTERKKRGEAKARKLLSHPDVAAAVASARFPEETPGPGLIVSMNAGFADETACRSRGANATNARFQAAREFVINRTKVLMGQREVPSSKRALLQILKDDLIAHAESTTEPVHCYFKGYGEIWTWVKQGQAEGKYALPPEIQKGGRPRKS